MSATRVASAAIALSTPELSNSLAPGLRREVALVFRRRRHDFVVCPLIVPPCSHAFPGFSPHRPARFVNAFRFAALILAALAQAAHGGEEQTIGGGPFHLGTAGFPQWQDFAGRTPHGRQLDLDFAGRATTGVSTLFLRQEFVKENWEVVLNGRRIGRLERLTQPLVIALAIPSGLMRDGSNRLSIVPPKAPDDIIVGGFTLAYQPPETALAGAGLRIQVTDATDGAPLPCRITITDESGALTPFQISPSASRATRTGVIYTADGSAGLHLRPGAYRVYAGRGFEYSVAQSNITLAAAEDASLALKITREVSTPGKVAADSHIHTLTHSKHGDAAIVERMLTIAGEGIEVAIATDHNHHADYREPARTAGVMEHFTPVVGNEVTTPAGHFNAFPVEPAGPLPDHKLTAWEPLLRNIRAVTGAKVITLNHPRDVHEQFTPLGPARFDPVVGEVFEAPAFDCDAIEVVTSGALQSDILQLYRDWFALINFGARISAIGASDTHDVSRLILGQGRTYVACNDANPAKINVDDVCASYRAGKLWVSLGLLTDMQVDSRFGVGDLATRLDREVTVSIQVQGPSWTQCDKVELYANGIKVREAAITPGAAVQKANLVWTIRNPGHDVALVAIATGPGVTAPYWAIPRPYQPTSRVFAPRVIGSTNPVWLDGDGDGQFTPARRYAEKLMMAAGDPTRLLPALGRFDEAVAAQAARLCERAGAQLASDDFQRLLRKSPPAVRAGFAHYLSYRGRPPR